MNQVSSARNTPTEVVAESALLRIVAWIANCNLPFVVISVGIIVMLLWTGAYKMTVPGAEDIMPLVSNSPLIWWRFKLFGRHIGSNIVGLTEISTAFIFLAGYLKPKAGIAGGLVTTFMFYITSMMVFTTPGVITSVRGMRYMTFLGLILFKDFISLGASLYLVNSFAQRATQRVCPN